MRRLVGISLVSLTGCLLYNPAYGDGDGATGSASESGAATGASTGGAPPTTGATSTDGSAGSASASGTGDPTTGTTATTGEVSAGTGSTGQADTGSSTGQPPPPPPAVSCPGQEIVLTIVAPARDTFVVTTGDASCQWKNSDGNVLNQNYPCAKQNYGGYDARYTVIGQLNGGHAEYLVLFGLFDALDAMGIDPEEVVVASAKLQIVAWWSADRGPVSFRVGAIADSDVWAEGNKGPDLATNGDSSWEYRLIEGPNAMHTWTNPGGPAAGSTQVTTVEVPALLKTDFDQHPYQESGQIAGVYLQPWIEDPAAERGFVITTDDAPILVKSIGTGWDPKLALTLCPLL